jgi:hypothetical protein
VPDIESEIGFIIQPDKYAGEPGQGLLSISCLSYVVPSSKVLRFRGIVDLMWSLTPCEEWRIVLDRMYREHTAKSKELLRPVPIPD